MSWQNSSVPRHAGSTARVWDLSAEHLTVQVLDSHDGDISAVQFSSDGSWLATGSVDSVVRLWHLTTEDIFEEVIS
ncbi:hypothetical protein ACFLXI_08220 [Chloroflexota bacterium]